MKHAKCILMIIAILMQLMIVSAGYAYGEGTTVGVSSNNSVDSATVQTEDGKDSCASISAINGTWRGKDTLGDIQVTIIAGELIVISHPGSDQPHEAGVMTADGSTINATLYNGTKKACRYLISNNTMTFADETLQSSVVLTRVPDDTALSANDAKLMGTWGCTVSDTYVEVTFTQGGKIYVAIPSEDGLIHEYVYAIDGHTLYVSRDNDIEVAEFKFSGDNFLLSEDGHNGTFTHRPGPLQRIVSEPITSPTSEDAAVLGTWGGMQSNLYVEWTFHGDGTFERYVPQDDTLSYVGVYTARNGQMTMTAKNATLRAQYTAYEDIIGLSFSESDSFGYYRKTGPLTRILSSDD